MKAKLFFGFMMLLVLAASCDNGPIRSAYRPILPELPDAWNGVLGEPRWRFEWVAGDGVWQEWEGSETPEIPLIQEWASPVLAWPYWPERELLPGMIRPAGAIFPWDLKSPGNGKVLALSWKGGVDAVFWKEMALVERSTEASAKRLPWYFDWPRFRELLESENIPEAVRRDPWLADWKEIARKTILSGFDRRRIVSASTVEFVIPGLGGSWTGSSPFSPLLEAPPEGPLRLRVRDVPDTWVSANAVLRCSKSGYVLIPGFSAYVK